MLLVGYAAGGNTIDANEVHPLNIPLSIVSFLHVGNKNEVSLVQSPNMVSVEETLSHSLWNTGLINSLHPTNIYCNEATLSIACICTVVNLGQ